VRPHPIVQFFRLSDALGDQTVRVDHELRRGTVFEGMATVWRQSDAITVVLSISTIGRRSWSVAIMS
jgi:hypothetical protein